jgi:hypothetical protein
MTPGVPQRRHAPGTSASSSVYLGNPSPVHLPARESLVLTLRAVDLMHTTRGVKWLPALGPGLQPYALEWLVFCLSLVWDACWVPPSCWYCVPVRDCVLAQMPARPYTPLELQYYLQFPDSHPVRSGEQSQKALRLLQTKNLGRASAPFHLAMVLESSVTIPLRLPMA